MLSVQFALTPPLATVMIARIAGYVAKQLEPRIRRKRINQYGGMQFDSDIRGLVAFFVDKCSRRIRGRFTRLLQISQILNLERPAELLEYWGSNAGGITWELTADEARSILSLRVDFSPAEISRLKL